MAAAEKAVEKAAEKKVKAVKIEFVDARKSKLTITRKPTVGGQWIVYAKHRATGADKKVVSKTGMVFGPVSDADAQKKVDELVKAAEAGKWVRSKAGMPKSLFDKLPVAAE